MDDKLKLKIDKCKFSYNSFLEKKIICTKDDKETNEERCNDCELYKSRYIEYPITINEIQTEEIRKICGFHKIGVLVAVKPCGEEYNNKTYLGFYLGELPISICHTFNENLGILKAFSFNNPAIFVPELNKIVYGCESWWHEIKSEDDFKEITDNDINNTWYVKLAKKMMEEENNDGK